MSDLRPDPDELLARAKAEEEKARRGRLKIFFGFAPGVGKTFAMLQDARSRKKEGADVVVGVVETHRRAETEALIENLEILPRREVPYHGVRLHEFDLDAALARRPALILVDELAHTNAPGSRHAKRWQDVEELLSAGIDVHTAINVQHVESLSDVVSQITGVIVHETVPDSLLERADELELIDLPPEELIDRLNEGKVYLPEQAGRAIESFFRKGNLIALRELSLRRTADRVAAQMVDYRRDQAIQKVWHASESLLVAVGPSPSSARLVRATKRMAESQHADWYAISVEGPAHARLTLEDKNRIAQTLRMAEQLGAKTATVSGDRLSDTILKFAREHNITKIVAGKPLRRGIRDRLFGSIVDELIWNCGEIDIYVISGEGDSTSARAPRVASQPNQWADYLWPVGAVVGATLLAWPMFYFFALANLIMMYLLAVVLTSVMRGRKASVIAACLSVAFFNFFFVPPHLTFAVADSQYLITFAVMLGVGLLISDLTARVQDQAQGAFLRERATRVLFELSRSLARATNRAEINRIATEHAGRILQGHAFALLPDPSGRILQEATAQSPETERERSVAQWVLDHGEPAGMGTDTLSGADSLYLPIASTKDTLGVLKLKPETPFQILDPERLRFMSTLASQIAQALEREKLVAENHAAQMHIESEKMRNVLLSSVSHDLRTPLTVISGAASTLNDPDQKMDEKTRREFIQTISDEAHRLDRVVANLLEMSRLESGVLQINREWHVLEEVIGVALNRLDEQLKGRDVSIHVEPDLPLIKMDDLLMEKVLINLIENAVKHTPAGTAIEISAKRRENIAVIEIADRGPGLAVGDEVRIFEKFYQSGDSRGRRGVGLGLAISRTLIEAQGGCISAHNREGGGAIFSFTLPIGDDTPNLNEATTEGIKS